MTTVFPTDYGAVYVLKEPCSQIEESSARFLKSMSTLWAEHYRSACDVSCPFSDSAMRLRHNLLWTCTWLHLSRLCPFCAIQQYFAVLVDHPTMTAGFTDCYTVNFRNFIHEVNLHVYFWKHKLQCLWTGFPNIENVIDTPVIKISTTRKRSSAFTAIVDCLFYT